jgi:hypothetical protein
MRQTLFVVLVFVLALGGCKKPQPSLDYLKARGDYDVLVAREGDEAYFSLDMAQIEGLLKRVPSKSPDYAAAQGLQLEITTRRKDIQTERERHAKELADANKPAVFSNDSPRFAQPAAAPAAVEAAAKGAMPKVGMTVSEFESQFGGCFASGPQITMADSKEKAGTYLMKDITNCRDRHPDLKETMVLVKDGKVMSMAGRKEMKKRTQLPDGGVLIEDL